MYSEIPEKYYTIIEDYFGPLYRRYNDMDPYDAASHIMKLGTSKRMLYEISFDLREEINHLWDKYETRIDEEISNLKGVRSCYGGDISPSDPETFIKKTALYNDTILIPDPLSQILNIFEPTTPEKHYVFYLMKYFFKMMKLKDIHFSDTDQPIVYLFPRTNYKNAEDRRYYMDISNKELILYFNELCNISLDTEDDLKEFLNANPGIENLSDKIVNKDILFPDFNNESVLEGLKQGLSSLKDEVPYYTLKMVPSQAFSFYNYGRFLQITEHLSNSYKYKSYPSFDAPRPWSVYQYIQKRDNSIIADTFGDIYCGHTLVSNALQMEEFDWLGNVPLDSIEKIRKEGYLSDLRSTMNDGISEMANCYSDDFEEVIKQVSNNLEQAFIQHQEKVKSIEDEFFRKRLISIGKVIISGAITITGALFPPFAIATTAAGVIVGGPSVMDLLSEIKEKNKAIKELKNRPIGIMFQAQKGVVP